MRPCTGAAFLLCALALRAAPVTERIFGPGTPTGLYKHAASICALPNGYLLLVYYGGAGEYAQSTALFLSRLKKGQTAWSAPREAARDPLRSTGNGVFWQSPDGRVWLFYVIRFGDPWRPSRTAVKISTGLGAAWSDSTLLRLEEGWMVRGKPIVLSCGQWLLPVYHETGADRERAGPASVSFFLIHDPATGRWTPSQPIGSKNGNLQPSRVELPPGHILAFCRRGGGDGPQETGSIVASESLDGGGTWTPGPDTPLPNPNSAIELLKLRSGPLLLVFNPSMHRRTPLTAARSEDGGRSWPWRLDVASRQDSFAYPSAVQTSGGQIHMVYSSHERTLLCRTILEESDMLAAPQRR